ncbi:MAG: thioredoxin [Alkalispirochaeta sp.]
MNMTSARSIADTIEHSPHPVVVEFWAPWCGPCRQMEPIITDVSSAYEDRVSTIRVNADEHPDLARDYRIMSIPTMVVFDNGTERARRAGAQNRGDLEELYRAAAAGETIAGMSQRARFFRIAIAAALAVMAQEMTIQWPYYLAAGAVFFSAIHDRCPVWHAIRRVFAKNPA